MMPEGVPSGVVASDLFYFVGYFTEFLYDAVLKLLDYVWKVCTLVVCEAVDGALEDL